MEVVTSLTDDNVDMNTVIFEVCYTQLDIFIEFGHTLVKLDGYKSGPMKGITSIISIGRPCNSLMNLHLLNMLLGLDRHVHPCLFRV